MARTLELDTITEPSNSGTANITLSSNTTTTMPLVDINGGAIDATTLGAGTPSSVAATTLSTSGNATVGGTLGVTGASTLASLSVTGASTLTGNTTVGGTFGVTGATTLAALTVTSINGTAVGSFSGIVQEKAENNIAGGADSLDGIETGSSGNVAIGYQCIKGTQADFVSNIAIGYRAMNATPAGNNQTMSGANNIAIGTQCMTDISSGIANVAIGYSSGHSISSGSYSTCVGHYTTCSSTKGVCLGSSSTVAGAYGISIGDGLTATQDKCVIGRSSNYVWTNFDTGDGSWAQVSDVRKKTDIQDCDLGLSFINALRTTTFRYKEPEEYPEEWGQFTDEFDDKGKLVERTYPEMDTVKKRHGMVAQEVKEAITEAGADDYFPGWSNDENDCQGLSYGSFVLPLIKAVQELSAKVKALESA